MSKKKKEKKKAKVLSFKDKREDIEVGQLIEGYHSRCGHFLNDLKELIKEMLIEHDGSNLVFLMNDCFTATKEISRITKVFPDEVIAAQLLAASKPKKDDDNE